jgi:hypothetical protein
MRPSCTSPRLQSDPGGPEAPRLQLPAALALSSREIRCVIPLIRHPQLRSNPTVLPSPSAYSNQRVDLRRPRGFSPPRRAAQKSSRACCISVPEGVRRVSRLQTPLAHPPPQGGLTRVRSTTAFLAAPFTPLEEVLPSVAAPHLCDPCPHVVAPPLSRRPSTSRPCSTGGSVTIANCCQWTTALSFLGFVPLQGSGQLGTTRPDTSPHRPNSTRTVDASTALPLQVTVLSAPATDRRFSRRTSLGHPSHRFSDSESVRSDPSAIRRLRTLLGFVTSKNLVDTHSEEQALP